MELNCSNCHISKPVNEFNKSTSKHKSHQYQRYCKECQRTKYKEWVNNNHAHKLEYTHQWTKDNVKEIATYDRERWVNGPKKLKTKELKTIHRERYNSYFRNHRARKNNAEGEINEDDVSFLLEQQNELCNGCRKIIPPFHVDHIIALSKGGSNLLINLQLLCPLCNTRKGATNWEKFKTKIKSGVYPDIQA